MITRYSLRYSLSPFIEEEQWEMFTQKVRIRIADMKRASTNVIRKELNDDDFFFRAIAVKNKWKDATCQAIGATYTSNRTKWN